MTSRHYAEVASDKLAVAADRWRDKFTAEERDMIGRVRFALGQIADGTR